MVPRYGTSNVKIQKLTGTGPNGEDVFLVTVPNKPSWNCPLYINAKLTPTSQAGGGYSESTSSLLKIIVNNNDVGGTTSSVKVGNTTYTVVAATGNNDGTNNAQYYSYTFPNVGTSELASDSYWIGSVTASLVNTDATSNQTGHELLTIHKLHIKPGKIQNGSYINIKMGLTDSNNQLIPYDKTLADTKPVTLNGTQIGTLYGLGKLGYYRLVFNEAAVSANATKAITLNGDNDEGIQVVWNRAGSRYPSLDKDNGVDLLYQYTANASQNNSRFSVTPQKDITIGTYTYTSGYTVYGRYVLQGNHYQANKTTGPIWSYSARTWLTNTALGGPQGWFQNFNEALDTDDLGNDFSITVKAPKSTDQITINAATADQLAKEIEDIESSSAKLTNTVNATQVNGQNLYANVETTKPTTVIKPTVTLTTSTGTDGLTTYTYHVKFGSAVPSLSGTVWLLSAGTSMPFTVPNGITTYNDDKAKTITKGNYSGHDTSNQTLLTALSTLPKVQVVVRKTGASKDADDTTSSWGGAVQISSPTDLAANQVAASVSPYTVNTQTITGTTRQKPSDLDVQSGITAVLNDGQVISNGLNLIDWTKTHWFDSTKDQATWNKVYGTSGSKEPSYPKINDYGYLVQTEAGTTEPYTATIVFKDGSELFADIPVVVNATDADQATDVAYADSIFNGGNELNYHEVTFQLLVRDKNGNPVLGSDGKPTYKTVTKKIYESSLKDDWNSTKDGKPVYALNLYHQASDFVRNVEEGATYSFDNTKTITAYNGKDTKNIGVTTDQLMSNYNDHSIVNAFGDYRQFNIVIKATYADGSSRLINSRMTVLDTPLGNNVYVRWGGTDGKGTCPKPLNSWIVNLDTTGTEFWKPQAVTTYDDDDFNRPDLMPDLTDPNNLNQTGAVIVSYKNVDGQMDSDGNIVSPAATGQVWSAAVTFKVVGFQTTNHYIFQGQTNPYKFPTASLTLGDATNNYGYLGDFIVDKDDGSGNVDKTTHVRGVGKSVLSESMPVNTTLTAKWVKGSLNTAIAGDNDLQETLTFSTNPGTNYTQIKLIDGITTDSNGGYGDVAPDITYLIHPNGDLTKTNTTMSKTARLVVLALPTGGTIHLHKGNANNVTTLDNWLTSNGTNKGDAVSASDKAITNIDTTKDYMPHAITGWNDPTTVHNEIANAGTYYAEVMVTYQDPNDATKTITIPYATLASLIKNQNKVTIVVQPYVLKDADIWVWYGDKNDYEANAGKQETLSFDNPLIWNSLFPQIVQIPYSDWPSTKISIKMPDKVGYEQPADAEITYKDGSTQVIQVGVLALQYPTLKPIVLNSGDDTKVLSTTILDTLGSTSSNKNAGEINGSTDGYVSNTPGNYQMRVTLTYNVPDASRFDKSIYQSVEKHAFTINVLRLGELQKGYTGSNASLIVTVDPTTGVVNKITLMKQSDDGSKAVPKDTYKRQKDGTYVDNNGNIFGAKKDDTKAKVSTVKTTAFKVADFEQLINMNQMAGMFVSLAWAPESKVSLKDNQLTGTVQAKLKTGNTINIPVDTTVELDEQPGTGNKGGSTTPTKPSTGDKGSTTTPTKPSTGDKGGTTSPTKPSTGDKAGTTMPTKPSTGDKGDTTTPTKSSTGNKGGSTTPTKPSTNDKGGTTTPTKPSTGNKGGTTTPTKPSTGDKGGATTPTKPNTGNKGGTTTPTKPSSGDKGDTTTPTKSNTGNKGGTTTPTKPSTGNKGGSTTPTKPSDQHKGQTDPDATNYDLPSLLMIIYRDGNGQTVKTDQVEGKVGSSTTLIFAVPAGYHVVGTLPSSSYTFNGSDMPLIIEVAKDVAPTTPTKPSTGDKGGATTPAKPSTGDKGGTTPTKPSTGNKGGTTTPTKPSSGNKGGTTTPTKPSTGNKGDTTTPTKPSTGNKGGTTTPTKPSTGNKGGTTAPTKPSDQHKGQTDSDATNYDLPSLLMIIYRDGNGQTIKTDQVEGKVGSSTTLTFAVPAGYHVVGTLPSSSYTFNGSDMPLIIDVAKDVASTTPTAPTKPSSGNKGGTTAPTKPSTGDKGSTTTPTKPSTGDKGSTTTPTKPSTGDKGSTTTPTKPSTGDKGSTTTPTKPNTGNKGGSTTTPAKPTTGDKGSTTTPTKPSTDDKGSTTTPAKPSTGNKGGTTTPTKPSTGNKGGTTTKPSAGDKGGTTTPTTPRKPNNHQSATDQQPTTHDLPSLLLVVYRDQAGQTLKIDEASGMAGSHTTLHFAAPNGYHIVGNTPNTDYTFNGQDAPILIEVAKDNQKSTGSTSATPTAQDHSTISAQPSDTVANQQQPTTVTKLANDSVIKQSDINQSANGNITTAHQSSTQDVTAVPQTNQYVYQQIAQVQQNTNGQATQHQQLPQTGNRDDSALVALGISGMLASLGIVTLRKREA